MINISNLFCSLDWVFNVNNVKIIQILNLHINNEVGSSSSCVFILLKKQLQCSTFFFYEWVPTDYYLSLVFLCQGNSKFNTKSPMIFSSGSEWFLNIGWHLRSQAEYILQQLFTYGVKTIIIWSNLISIINPKRSTNHTRC